MHFRGESVIVSVAVSNRGCRSARVASVRTRGVVVVVVVVALPLVASVVGDSFNLAGTVTPRDLNAGY